MFSSTNQIKTKNVLVSNFFFDDLRICFMIQHHFDLVSITIKPWQILNVCKMCRLCMHCTSIPMICKVTKKRKEDDNYEQI